MKSSRAAFRTPYGTASREIESSRWAMRSCDGEPIVRHGLKRSAAATKSKGARRTYGYDA